MGTLIFGPTRICCAHKQKVLRRPLTTGLTGKTPWTEMGTKYVTLQMLKGQQSANLTAKDDGLGRETAEAACPMAQRSR